jgi:uncharacterized protein (TIGR03118 family)
MRSAMLSNTSTRKDNYMTTDRRLLPAMAVLAIAISNLQSTAAPANTSNEGYAQLNLVASEQALGAKRTDTNFVNAWGLATSSSTEWVANNGSGRVTGYSAGGSQNKTVIHIPAPGGDKGAPTGVALNGSSSFVINNGSKNAPATLLIATEDGTIVGWNPSCGTNGIIVVDRSGTGANYKGIAIARSTNGVPHIYAANFRSDYIDEFDDQFNYVQSFTDPEVPGSGFAPFNIRTLRGRLFVTLARKATESSPDDLPGPGNGFIVIFDTGGTMLRDFAETGPLNSPWGMAIAPKHFGKFSHALLVGNFGDGRINGYDLLTGKWLGALKASDGTTDLVIDGLWGLSFEKDEVLWEESSYNAQRLYFTSGPNDETNGLFGVLRPASPNFPPAQ